MRPAVIELVGKLGFKPVDAGPLKNARLLEPFAYGLDRPSDRAGLRFCAGEREVINRGRHVL